jgi:hypothetical protein
MDPRISVNKLGEYMTATPARRRQIVKDQKNRPAFKAARYRDARDAISSLIASGSAGEARARDFAEGLRRDPGGSDFAMQDRAHSAAAIDTFVEIRGAMKIDDLIAVSADARCSDAVEMAGVRVVARPDALLLDPRSLAVVGCVKLHFSKSQPLDEKGGNYVATAMQTHLERNLSAPGLVLSSRCYVVDIATRRIHTAPKARKRRLGDLAAACEEIKDRWEKL